MQPFGVTGEPNFACTRAGIAVYWIVDLANRSVEVYTDPDPRSVKPTYINREGFGERSKIPVEIAGKVIGKIRVANLLP